MQTSENYLHLYAIHLWKDNLLHSSCNVALKDVQKVDIYLKSSIRMDSETRALSITGDSRLLLVGFADGTVASLSWSGKVMHREGMTGITASRLCACGYI